MHVRLLQRLCNWICILRPCPVLGLDGTHLKSKFQGILLCATGIDANGSLFPLAYAIVDTEKDDNWL